MKLIHLITFIYWMLMILAHIMNNLTYILRVTNKCGKSRWMMFHRIILPLYVNDKYVACLRNIVHNVVKKMHYFHWLYFTCNVSSDSCTMKYNHISLQCDINYIIIRCFISPKFVLHQDVDTLNPLIYYFLSFWVYVL